MEENLKNEVSNIVGNEMLEAKRQLYFRLPEFIVTVVSVILGVVMMCFNLGDFWGLAVIVFGALWNFFTDANKLFACIVSFFVCTIFALISLNFNLYGLAFLHICFYLPTQLIYFYESKKSENLNDTRNKELTKVGTCGAIISVWLFALSITFVLYKVGDPYYLVDAICVTLLSFSVFLSNGQYKEYWFARLIACFVTSASFVYIAVDTGYAMNSLMFALLFLMYLISDTIKFNRWIKSYKNTETGK